MVNIVALDRDRVVSSSNTVTTSTGQPKNMRVSIRSFVGLIIMGVVMPSMILILWSNGKTQKTLDDLQKMDASSDHEMPGIGRDRWYSRHENFHADIFRDHPIVKQTIQTSKPFPKEPLKVFPNKKPPGSSGQTSKPLPKEVQKPLPKEVQKPLPKEVQKPLPKEVKKPLIKEPSRPWIYKNPDGSQLDTYRIKAQAFKERDRLQSLKGRYEEPRSGNGDSQKTWRSTASLQQKAQSQWWKQHMRNACRELGMTQSPDSLTPEMLQNVIVDDKNKLLFCQIAKVASTTWRRVFLQLTGRVDVSDFLAISANDIHHKYDKHFTYLSQFSKEEISLRLRDYFKFVFVREPFERILSAYKNKFYTHTQSADYFKWKFGRKIIAKFRRPRTLIPLNNTGDGVTFEEFSSYLVDERKRIIMNEHWEVFHKMCHPCIIDYDFVGHLERIDEDSQFVLDSNALSDRIKVPNRSESKYSYRKTNSYMKEYYSQLKPETISRLFQRYKADYLIFNYTLPADVLPLMYNKSVV